MRVREREKRIVLTPESGGNLNDGPNLIYTSQGRWGKWREREGRRKVREREDRRKVR